MTLEVAFVPELAGSTILHGKEKWLMFSRVRIYGGLLMVNTRNLLMLKMFLYGNKNVMK